MSRQVGGVILVVHGGKTPKEAVQKARNLLMSVNAKILGTLVNNVKMDAVPTLLFGDLLPGSRRVSDRDRYRRACS